MRKIEEGPLAAGVLHTFLLMLILTAVSLSVSAQEHVLYAFQAGTDGSQPFAGVIADASGNLYGTTGAAGINGFGTVFELMPPTAQGGPWAESVLYSFQGLDFGDGTGPQAALVFDNAGNLYGTTLNGGQKASDCAPSGCGIVFELSPPSVSGGQWTETILHIFGTGTDGIAPFSNLTFDRSGSLHGTTIGGGSTACGGGGCGAVFELSPPAVQGGAWTEQVIYAFQGGTDGLSPAGSLVADSKGILYGATRGGGKCSSCGTAFKLIPPAVAGGTWTERIVHYFNGNSSDGMTPPAGPAFYKGSFYGATEFGGQLGLGTVYQLTLSGGGRTETVLYNFGSNPADSKPITGVVSDGSGNLYGVNSGNAHGTIFELQPPSQSGENWTENLLYGFSGGSDGGIPLGNLLLKKGTLYGTTAAGGDLNCGLNGGCGVVFAITP